MKKSFFLMVMALFMTGCSHPLHITNIDEMSTPAKIKPKNPVKIGFESSNDILINAAIEETSMNTMVKETKKDYQPGTETDLDYVVKLSNTINYSASGQNFPITFPGFLIFTHAWLGYKYYATIDTQSTVSDNKGTLLSDVKISTPYEFRHTSFARGATSSLVGYLTPGWGVLDIIPGMIFSSSYDDRATPDFIEKAQPSFKKIVSNKLLEQIGSHQNSLSSNPSDSPKTEAIYTTK